jgi:VanZ family protein
MLLMIALSSIPGVARPDDGPGPAAWIPPLISNALHVPLYAGLGFLYARALTFGARLKGRRAALLALALGAAFGGLDELYQSLIPGRSTAFGDWLADTAGAAIGSSLFTYLHRENTRESRSDTGP